ncbi:MAG: nucleoid occlusion protein [Clostridia bacterium]|nr:nucleoid occlusion protein [Clostridia bacterium]
MVGQSLSRFFGLNNVDDQGDVVREIYIDLIRPNPYQPRKHFDSYQLEELAKSINIFGVLQPIIVRKNGNYYDLIAGERRLRACQNLGYKTIPSLIRSMSDRDIAEIALIENLQRENLNYFEEAEGYRKLIQEFHLTQEEVAHRVGKSQSTIANKIRLLKLPHEVRLNIMLDVITERHARALLKLPDTASQLAALREIYTNNLNVKDTDALVDAQLRKNGSAPRLSQGKKVLRIFKDLRLYVNTLRSAVSTIKEAGINVKMSEKEYEQYVEVIVQIRKPHPFL